MKRNITLLSRTLMLTILLTSLAIVLGASNYARAFLPETPLTLTILDHNEQVYQAECPNLTQVMHLSPVVSKLTLPFTILNWNIYKQKNVTIYI